MARLFTSCFGMNTLFAAKEWDAAVGPTITTITLPSGNAGFAGFVSSLVSATNQRFRMQFKASGVNGPLFFRFYFQVTTLPSAENRIFALSSSATAGASVAAYITLDNTGALRLYDTGLIGSASPPLALNKWYRIEMLFDRSGTAGAQVVRAMIDGVSFASGTAQTLAGSVMHVYYGGNLNSETQTTGAWYFANVAINDNTGSFQRSYPGPGHVVHLNPTQAGDANTFALQVGGTAGAANNFTRVNDVPADDVTSYNGASTAGQEDLLRVAASGIPSNSIVNVVVVGARFANLTSADATSAIRLELLKASGGTKAQSTSIIPNSTTWKTNTAAVPWTHPLVTYQDPDGVAWTQATLDTMQVGYTLSAAGTQAIAISGVWALVEYAPSSGRDFFMLF